MERLSATALRGLLDLRAWTLLGTPIEAALFIISGQYALRWVENGVERVKFLSAAALKEAFSLSPVDSGWIKPGVVRWGTGASGEWSVKWVPPGSWSFNLSGELITVPLPGLVYIQVNRKDHFVLATDGAEFSPRSRVFEAPLPNVYADGRICWGVNATPDSAEDGWRLFIESPFNQDLGGGRSVSFPNNISGALHRLARSGAASYPLGDLVPCSAYRTVDDAVAALVTGGRE